MHWSEMLPTDKYETVYRAYFNYFFIQKFREIKDAY